MNILLEIFRSQYDDREYFDQFSSENNPLVISVCPESPILN